MGWLGFCSFGVERKTKLGDLDCSLELVHRDYYSFIIPVAKNLEMQNSLWVGLDAVQLVSRDKQS